MRGERSKLKLLNEGSRGIELLGGAKLRGGVDVRDWADDLGWEDGLREDVFGGGEIVGWTGNLVCVELLRCAEFLGCAEFLV